jgi:hypothetical protein
MSSAEIKKLMSLDMSFSEYIFKHPEVMAGVPRKACIVFTGKAFPSLSRKNLRLARQIMKERRIACYRADKKARGWVILKVEAAR